MAQLEKNRLQHGRLGFYPWVRKIPWRRERLPTPMYSGVENPINCIDHEVAKRRTRLSDNFTLHFNVILSKVEH